MCAVYKEIIHLFEQIEYYYERVTGFRIEKRKINVCKRVPINFSIMQTNSMGMHVFRTRKKNQNQIYTRFA